MCVRGGGSWGRGGGGGRKLLLYFIVPCEKFRSHYLGIFVYFCVSKQWYGCQCLGFLTCAPMLMNAIAHGGYTDTVRKFALEA